MFDDIVHKHNNTVHRTIKRKPADVTSHPYAKYNEDSNFKLGDRVTISKYKNSFANGYTQNWYEKVFIISKIKNTVPWTYVISDLYGKKIYGTFYEKELEKTSQEKSRIEKVIKKSDKLYVKWKGTIIRLIVGLIKKTMYKN